MQEKIWGFAPCFANSWKIPANSKDSLCRKAIETVAGQNGVSSEEVRRAIREAIEEAHKNAAPETETLWRGMTESGERPTPEEFILWAVRRMGC